MARLHWRALAFLGSGSGRLLEARQNRHRVARHPAKWNRVAPRPNCAAHPATMTDEHQTGRRADNAGVPLYRAAGLVHVMPPPGRRRPAGADRCRARRRAAGRPPVPLRELPQQADGLRVHVGLRRLWRISNSYSAFDSSSPGRDRRRGDLPAGNIADRGKPVFHRLDRGQFARDRPGRRHSCVWHSRSNHWCYRWVALPHGRCQTGTTRRKIGTLMQPSRAGS